MSGYVFKWTFCIIGLREALILDFAAKRDMNAQWRGDRLAVQATIRSRFLQSHANTDRPIARGQRSSILDRKRQQREDCLGLPDPNRPWNGLWSDCLPRAEAPWFYAKCGYPGLSPYVDCIQDILLAQNYRGRVCRPSRTLDSSTWI